MAEKVPDWAKPMSANNAAKMVDLYGTDDSAPAPAPAPVQAVPDWAKTPPSVAPVPDWAKPAAPPAIAPIAHAPDWAKPAAAQPAKESAIAELGRRESDTLSGALLKDIPKEISKPYQKDATAGPDWLQRVGDVGGRIGSVATDVLGTAASPVEAGVKTTLNRALPESIKGDQREKLVQDIGDVGTAALLAPAAIGKAGKAAEIANVIEKPAIKVGKDIISGGDSHDAIIANHPTASGGERGFIDAKGDFVLRPAAAKIAENAGEVQRSKEVTPGKLHSEDLPVRTKPQDPQALPQLKEKMVDLEKQIDVGGDRAALQTQMQALVDDWMNPKGSSGPAAAQQRPVATPAPPAPGVGGSLRNLVSPTSAGPGAGRMETTIRENQGLANRNIAQAEATLEPSSKLAAKMTPTDIMDYYNHVEGRSAGVKLKNPTLQKFADDTRNVMKNLRSQLEAMPEGDQIGFYEDYFPHMWKNVEKARQFTSDFIGKQGSSAALKKRTKPTIEDGLRAGLEPAELNPIKAASRHVTSMNNYIGAKNIVDEAKRVGDAGYFAPGKQPEGWVPMTGRFSEKPGVNVVGGEEGNIFVPAKKLYAPADVARIHNNYYSKGFEGTDLAKPYEALRKATSANTAAELALSAYHASTITAQSVFNDMARAFKNGLVGDWKGVGKAVKQATAGQIPFVKGSTYKIGNQLSKQYKGLEDYGLDVESIADHFARGGGKVGQDKLYRGNAEGGFVQAARRGQLGQVAQGIKDTAKSGVSGPAKAALEVLGRATEDVSYPLFEHYIPRVKMGAFSNLMSDFIRQNPEATEKQIAAARKQYVDLVDDRFGEMNMDNIFWPKLQKQIASLFLRAQGWDIGLVRQAGGGILDTGRIFKDMISKKGFDKQLLDRPAFLAAAISGGAMMSAAYQYMKTGKAPDEMLDYMAPRTGGVTSSGEPERTQLPGHGKELVNMLTPQPGQGPLSGVTNELANKVASLPKNMYESWNNRDFRGDPIGETTGDMGWMGSLPARAGHIASGFAPFALGSQGAAKEGSNLNPVERRLFGMHPAGMLLTDRESVDNMVQKKEAKAWKTKMKHDAKAEGNLAK